MTARELVTEQDIINTYSDYDIESCKKYKQYLQLVKENPSFGYKRCAKILGVPQGRIRWWHTRTNKRGKPIPLKTVDKLKEAGFLPLTTKHKHIKEIFRIMGMLFGDGGIDIRLNTLAFISSKIEDIEIFKENLIEIFPFVKNKINIVEGGEYGHSYNIRTFDRAAIRLFVALGVPVGDKVSTPYMPPKNILSLSKKIRIAFLDGLISSEFSVPSWRSDNRGNYRFTNLTLGLSKIEKLEGKHITFLKSLKRLCKSVGVDTTPNIRKDFSKKTLRKDGNFSHCFRIFFRTHFHKVLFFDSVFPLIYAKDKKRRTYEQIEIAIKYKRKKQKLGKELLKVETEQSKTIHLT
ncbi:MAG: hypothetical protein V1672_03855 [Candidatus Diapherotrites archaeon]